MSTKPCRDCRNTVSERAEKCPHCGAPVKSKSSMGAWLLLIVIGVGAVGAMSGRSNNPANSSESAPEFDVKYTHQTTNIRKGTSTDTPVVGQASAGTRIIVLEQAGEWARVSVPGVGKGYIYNPLLSSQPPAKPAATSGNEALFVELRNEGICNTGWVAGNATGHPVWPQIRPYVGRGGEYYTTLVSLKAKHEESQTAAFANVGLYDECFERGRNAPYNEAEITSRVERLSKIPDELRRLM